MVISLEKCVFHVKTVDFLVYVVATNGATMNEKIVETIKAWKPPTSVREDQIFIGFANFYRRYIKNFTDICTPITNLLEGKTGVLSREKINKRLSNISSDVLQQPRFFVIFTQTAIRLLRLTLAIMHSVESCLKSRINDYMLSPSTLGS